MKSFEIGFEMDAMMIEGAVMVAPILNPMKLTGIQIDCSMMFTQAIKPSDWAEVLCIGAHVTQAQWPNWQIPGDTKSFINTGGNPDVGPVDFSNSKAHGSAGGNGYLFSMIIKSGAMGRGLYIPLDMEIARFDGLFFHMDHYGTIPCDVEMQGVVFYK